MLRRSIFALAGLMLAGPVAAAAAAEDRADLQQDRTARSLCPPDRGGLHARPRIRDPGQDGDRWPQDPGHPQGRPAQARHGQGRARAGLWRRQGRHRRRHHRLADRARDAAGRRGVQEDPDRRARRGRPDHRRQVEPLHLPHRAQLLAGRAGRRGDAEGREHQHRHARPGQRLRQGRHRLAQGSAGGGRLEGQGRARGIRAGSRPPTSPPRASACSTR